MKTLVRLLLTVLALGVPGGLVAAQELTVRNAAKTVSTVTLEELRSRFPVATVELSDPHDGKKHRYQGWSMPVLLDSLYGKDWRADRDLLLECADGYRAVIAGSDLQARPSYLAFGHADGSEFRVYNQSQGEWADLGPFYLVWGSDKHTPAHNWPYQVVGMDLIRFQDRFPRTAPPEGSAPPVVRGFQAFRQHCLACHSINGEGGQKGVDLNYPVSATEYFSDYWLKALIDDPHKVHWNSTMPPLARELPNRQEVIDDLIAYLKAMADSKRRPEESTEPGK